jgi:P-type Cu+ transporter
MYLLEQKAKAPALPPSETLVCYHCHDKCPDDKIVSADKHFCCEGCKMVYEILNTHDLCNYYNLDEQAGVSLRHKNSIPAFTYLDNAEIEAQLLEFKSATAAKITFYLPQMHCISCVWLLEHLNKLDKGITAARVNFLKKQVTVQYNPNETSLRSIAVLLSSIGYEPDIKLSNLTDSATTKQRRKLGAQIAVAGFAFGNIMLFSFPEYVGMDAQAYDNYARIFGYGSVLLSLPVLFYSAKDYFISAWQGIKAQRLNIDIPLCLAFLALFLRSIWEIFTHTGAGYLDSFAGLTFLLLTGKWFQQTTWSRLSFERDYKSYFPIAAAVKKEGLEVAVPVHRLQANDIIIVRSQEIIPADGILTIGTADIDYSFVSGESEPVRVLPGEKIYAGGKQLGAAIEVTLVKSMEQSHLTRLWNNDVFQDKKGQNLSALADQAGLFFSWLVLAVGALAALYWWGYKGDMHTAINAFTAVMIVVCPCTIALSIPFTLGNIIRIMGKRGFYLKNVEKVEALANFDAVVFDKTGTITQVHRHEIDFVGAVLSPEQKVRVKSLANQSAHPLSRQLCGQLSDVSTASVTDFEEFTGLGISGVVEGKKMWIGSADFVQADADSSGHVYVREGAQILGYYEVRSIARTGLDRVFDYFRGLTRHRRPVPVFLVSGDRDKDAAMMRPYFGSDDTMLFRQGPQDKLNFVKNLQQKGRKVLMFGDGLNDAGALKQSDMGIVISEQSNNFTPACDAILDADKFDLLPRFIQLSKAGVRIVKQSYGVALLYNAIGISYAVSGTLSPLIAAILMPASSISMVLFGMGMGNWAARRYFRKGGE